MSKIIEKSNFRVIVEPRTHIYGVALSFVESDCETMVEEIKRHVDNVSRVYVDYDTDEICSHCGYTWVVDETGLPQCCTKAQKEFEEQTPISPADQPKTKEL